MFAFGESSLINEWIHVVSQVGVPVGLIIFFCIFIWSLRPHIVEWFRESTKQAKVVSEAIPHMNKSLEHIANDATQRLATVERKVDEILTRLHVQTGNT